MEMDQHAWPDRATPLQSVWSMALSAMMVESELFIHLFNLKFNRCEHHTSIRMQSGLRKVDYSKLEYIVIKNNMQTNGYEVEYKVQNKMNVHYFLQMYNIQDKQVSLELP